MLLGFWGGKSSHSLAFVCHANTNLSWSFSNINQMNEGLVDRVVLFRLRCATELVVFFGRLAG